MQRSGTLSGGKGPRLTCAVSEQLFRQAVRVFSKEVIPIGPLIDGRSR